MEFRIACIAGISYSEKLDESKAEGSETAKTTGGTPYSTFTQLRALLADPFSDTSAVAREYMTLLAVCHTVIPEVKEGKMVYQASSPDEAALVAGAEMLGYQFHASSKDHFFFHHPLNAFIIY